MQYEKTAEWWSADFGDGRKRCEVSGWELEAAYGTSANTWSNRRRTAKNDLRGVVFPPLATGGAAKKGEDVVPVEPVPEAYRETVEVTPTQATSDRLLEMSLEQSKDCDYLLAAHGFDREAWELVAAKNSIWNVYSKSDDPDNPHTKSTLYSSRITVKPRTSLDFAKVMEAARKVEPVTIERPNAGEPMLLELQQPDMHLGNSTLEWYRETLARTLTLVESRQWAEVVVPVGSDLFHVDNFKNTTSNGTAQSSVSWPEAWSDALRYYSAILEAALAHGVRVYGYYIIGNHDESMSWAFCQMLAAKYPQVVWDLDIEERKVHVFGDVAVGMTHGDGKNRCNLDRIFMSEFPEFAGSRIREVHAGHYHHELTRDEFGVVVRSLSTAARTDKWHREEGYVGAMKRFMCFEWTRGALEAVRYV